MHTDARTLADGTVLDGDLCIVGAGAAGIALALQFVGRGERVLLLEGGGFAYEPRMQALYRGESVGLPYFPLDAARLHYFGGTTGHWAGFCSPLDPLDFEPRDWVPHSGWPIARADLDAHYAAAHPLLDLGPYDYDPASWQRRDPRLRPLRLDPAVARTKMWQFSSPTRFGARYRDRIVGAPSVHLVTHATVVEIEATDGARGVEAVRVRTFEGKTLRARARRFVLACSTIQNARLLLASNAVASAGLGNGHDLVGRFFMEHLEMPSGHLAATGPWPDTRMYDFAFGRTKARGELGLTAAAQRARRVLNATVSLEPGALDAPGQSTFEWATPSVVAGMRSDAPAAADADTAPADTVPADTVPAARPRTFHLLTRQEQAPNPLSRVTLSRERDELGLPRARLDWRLTALDRASFRGFYEVLGRELGRAGVARVRMRDWVMEPPDAPWPASLGGGWHHMGTTRMHADPTRGVVDARCRVHGVGNLYVVGASVFPTAGCANPTLTIVALALRLAAHLQATG